MTETRWTLPAQLTTEQLEQELNDICADVQEGGDWARHRLRFHQLNDELTFRRTVGADLLQQPSERLMGKSLVESRREAQEHTNHLWRKHIDRLREIAAPSEKESLEGRDFTDYENTGPADGAWPSKPSVIHWGKHAYYPAEEPSPPKGEETPRMNDETTSVAPNDGRQEAESGSAFPDAPAPRRARDELEAIIRDWHERYSGIRSDGAYRSLLGLLLDTIAEAGRDHCGCSCSQLALSIKDGKL